MLPPHPDLVEELCRLLAPGERVAPLDARRRLQALLTRRGPGTLPGEAWPLLDQLWAFESRSRPLVRAADLPRLTAAGWGARVSLFRGDITTLGVDAVVNAANAGLTGCYQPFHACVDNAIHTAAGPRLREACGRIMALRGCPEPTSTATATEGFFLPARQVLHTVGPVVQDRLPSPEDATALTRCYTACLDVAAGLPDVASVAFCSISTGIFGYPIAAAAPLALATVRAWLEERGHIEHVVFVTFSAADEVVYEAAAREALHGETSPR